MTDHLRVQRLVALAVACAVSTSLVSTAGADGARLELAQATSTPGSPQFEILPLNEGDAPSGTDRPSREYARAVQQNLNRLGCRAGAEDGVWGGKSARALERFAESAGGIRIVSSEPNEALVRQLQGFEGRICPLVCAVTEVRQGETCVAKTCPSGQRLSSRGECVTPAPATASAAQPRQGGSSGGDFSALTGTWCFVGQRTTMEYLGNNQVRQSANFLARTNVHTIQPTGPNSFTMGKWRMTLVDRNTLLVGGVVAATWKRC